MSITLDNSGRLPHETRYSEHTGLFKVFMNKFKINLKLENLFF